MTDNEGHETSRGDGSPTPARIDPMVAHDLTNALAATLASARLIRNKAESDETKQLAEIILRQMDRAAHIIHEAANS